MKITHLSMYKITRYDRADMPFLHKISVILGPNAEGKTTIMNAILQALTGACALTDKAGKGQELMVATGEKQGWIELAISHGGKDPIQVTRFVPGELAIEGQHGNKTQLQANLCEYLGVETSVLSAALSTTAFIDAKPSDQKGLLFGLLGLSFDAEDIKQRVSEEIPRLAEAVTRIMNATPADRFTGEADSFDLLYKHFYTLRRDYKRDLKALGEPEQPKLVEEPPTAEIVELLEDLRGKRSELQKQVAASKANVGLRDRLIGEILDLRGKLENAGDPEANTAEYDNLVNIVGPLETQQDGLKRDRETFNEVADKLEGAGKGCPLGPDGLVECSMTKAKREKLVADLRLRAKAADEEWFKIKADLAPMELRRRELIPLRNVPSRLEIEAAIEAKEADLAALPLTDTSLPQADSEIATLTDRISEGERVLAAANREEGARAERDKQQEKRAGLEQTVEVLEALVDVLSPSGLPGKILSQTIGPIEERANARLQELTGGRYSLQLVLDPDFAVIVDHDGITTDLKRLSSSERQRVGIILQDAIVHLTGLRFLVIDNVDMLDGENRELLMDALFLMADDYDQIIVLSTIGPAGAHKPDPPIPGLAIYQLEDGQLREVG